MVSTLKSSVNKRLSQFENDNVYKIASVLDPRFELRWAEQDIDINTQLLREKFLEIGACDMNENDEDTFSPPAKKIKSDDFFDFMPTTPKITRHFSGKIDEIAGYLSESCIEMSENPLEYWKINCDKYPYLSKLACRYYQFKLHLPLLKGFSA